VISTNTESQISQTIYSYGTGKIFCSSLVLV